MKIKRMMMSLMAVAACAAGVASSNPASSAVFCFPASTGGATQLPFGNSLTGTETYGCNVALGIGGAGNSASGQGQSRPNATPALKQLCANHIVGSNTSVQGYDSSGNAVSGCKKIDSAADGVFACDTAGCDTVTKFDVLAQG